MRIISGIYKGHRIPFKLPNGIRPTTDRDKESIFNILSNLMEFEGKIIIDLFAGSGAISFEALSRGFAKAIMIDKNFRSIQYQKQVASHLRIDKEKLDISKKSAISFLKEGPLKADLIFIDPPYDSDLVKEVFDNLELSNDSDPIIIVESSKHLSFNSHEFEMLKEKSSGISNFYFQKKR